MDFDYRITEAAPVGVDIAGAGGSTLSRQLFWGEVAIFDGQRALVVGEVYLVEFATQLLTAVRELPDVGSAQVSLGAVSISLMRVAGLVTVVAGFELASVRYTALEDDVLDFCERVLDDIATAHPELKGNSAFASIVRGVLS